MKIVYSANARKNYRNSPNYQKSQIVTFSIGELATSLDQRTDKKSILEMNLAELRRAIK